MLPSYKLEAQHLFPFSSDKTRYQEFIEFSEE
jgi:hypothetical protein